ncbi:MAG: hypothetical protein ACJ74Z_18640 [Bryobacteraceae bacterium]
MRSIVHLVFAGIFIKAVEAYRSSLKVLGNDCLPNLIGNMEIKFVGLAARFAGLLQGNTPSLASFHDLHVNRPWKERAAPAR